MWKTQKSISLLLDSVLFSSEGCRREWRTRMGLGRFYVFHYMFLIYFFLTSATLLFWYKIKISVLKIAFLASSAFEREPLSWSDLRERQLRQVQAHQALAIAVLQEGIRQSTAEHSLRNMDSHIPPCQHLENTNVKILCYEIPHPVLLWNSWANRNMWLCSSWMRSLKKKHFPFKKPSSFPEPQCYAEFDWMLALIYS